MSRKELSKGAIAALIDTASHPVPEAKLPPQPLLMQVLELREDRASVPTAFTWL
jgi:hypothetical protein